MITQEQVPAVLHHNAFDNHGNKIGEIKHVYLDDATGQPEWLCIKTGLFGTRETFVPMRNAEIVSDHVEVPFEKGRVKDAPRVDVDAGGHLSAEEERELYRYYGVAWDTARTDRSAGDGMAQGDGRHERPDYQDTAAATSDASTADITGSPGMTGTAGVTGAAGMADGTRTAGVDDGTRTPGMDDDTRMSGISGMEETAGTVGSDDAMTRSEEHLHVGTEVHESGRARLRKYVVTEEQQVSVPVTHEEVRVEREPITDANREEAMRGPELTEAEHEVILHEERPHVTKETEPVERVRMTTEQVTEEATVSEEVRKERIEVEGDTGEPERPA